jgi:hypothetical protein
MIINLSEGYRLYDLRYGAESPVLAMPKTDLCLLNKPGSNVKIQFGTQGKVLIHCKQSEGKLKATIYRIVEVNNSKSFALRDGVDVPLETSVINVMEDIYSSQIDDRAMHYITGYLESNKYKPVHTRIKRKMEGPGHIYFYSGRYKNAPLLLKMLLPELRGTGFRQTCYALHGLVNKGPGKTLLEEINVFLPPMKTDLHVIHFYMNPVDGSLLRLQTLLRKSPNVKELFGFVEIYSLL